jgi:hypothetical protein
MNINLLYLPVYFFLSVLFLNRTVKSYEWSVITEDALIVLSIIFVLIIYSKVKYQDDGRYKVGIIEFFGVQIHFSVLLGCLVVEFCEGLFMIFGTYFDTNNTDKKFFG